MYNYADCCTRQSSRVLAQLYYQQANTQILATLFRRHRNTVFQLCLSYLNHRIEAEDATMEIFEFLQEYLQRYRIRNFHPWLMRFSRNYCIRRLEKQQIHILPITFSLVEDSQTEVKSRRAQKIEQLHLAMDQLKRPQRECLLGFYFEEKTYKEIAISLQLSPAAVKSHLQNGKRNLRNLLIQMRD